MAAPPSSHRLPLSVRGLMRAQGSAGIPEAWTGLAAGRMEAAADQWKLHLLPLFRLLSAESPIW